MVRTTAQRSLFILGIISGFILLCEGESCAIVYINLVLGEIKIGVLYTGMLLQYISFLVNFSMKV